MQSDEQIYEQVAKELEASPRQGLLIKCMAKCEGDENKGKAMYIETRVGEIKGEFKQKSKKKPKKKPSKKLNKNLTPIENLVFKGEVAFCPDQVTPFNGKTVDTCDHDDGEWTECSFVNGYKESEDKYVNGEMVLTVCYYSNGSKKEEVNYKNEKTHGFCTQYYENGSKKNVTKYKEGKRHGLEFGYTSGGSKIKRTEWSYGKKLRSDHLVDGKTEQELQRDAPKDRSMLIGFVIFTSILCTLCSLFAGEDGVVYGFIASVLIFGFGSLITPSGSYEPSSNSSSNSNMYKTMAVYQRQQQQKELNELNEQVEDVSDRMDGF